ncbi:tRNA (adenosine(37)-N6)-dimethylallyltransferase MiaA [Geodermatophilus dictyosporus]|uniref:tRNA (adenosine(37)-N6)-dimethylallyltransferase MiaA n=1 Tax=Geodermatophilus dictyosporus TaxID=1523247 RepID=UPI000B85C850|nr:tRNA (adenosine(37)-N6)-dimethylallyltransferase MiaA [Geodermatophilus dictyosporus]
MSAPPVVAVVGPTATGKTALAVELARRLGGEVVNADSMQLYRGMDIGTAKPGAAERRGVPHHLLDVWHVRQAASVVEYARLARAAVDRLRAAGTVPLLVGGSGLYVRAVLDDLDFPGTDPAVRARLQAELADAGPAALHARLAAVDPEAAAAVLPSNGRRIVRALEVVELTGRPFRATLPEPRPRYPAVVVGLDREPAELDARVAERVDRMWAAGFVAEVEALAAEGLREGPTAARALGYAQVLAQLDGALTADDARERTVTTTRRFVRRQRSWFRRDAATTWFDAARPDLADAVGGLLAGRTIGR